MSTLDSMKKVLEPLNLYNIQSSSTIYAELLTYAQELDSLNNELEIIQREGFINTAQDYGLSLREELIGSVKESLSSENRREMLIKSFGVTENDFTKESMEESLKSCGIKASIAENPSENKVQVQVEEILDSTVSEEKIELDALEILPSHLEVEIDFNS